MNVSEPDIESLLRRAPKPRPPLNLKPKLLEGIELRPASSRNLQIPGRNAVLPSASWFQRWWPALAPATLSLACAAVFTAQQIEVRHLQDTIQDLSRPLQALAQPAPATQPDEQHADANGSTTTQDQELDRLRQSVQQLSNEVSGLNKLRQENDQLRAQLLASAAGSLNQQQADELAKARDKALNIQCVNNLKQLGLAARIWATDNQEVYPADLLQMTNEMSTPKILHCPADTARTAANGWADYTPANCSYEYLAPAGTDQEPLRVLFRCPIHGNIGLCDGSVQSGVAKVHPERLVEHDGKLYYEQDRLPELTTPPAVPGQPGTGLR